MGRHVHVSQVKHRSCFAACSCWKSSAPFTSFFFFSQRRGEHVARHAGLVPPPSQRGRNVLWERSSSSIPCSFFAFLFVSFLPKGVLPFRESLFPVSWERKMKLLQVACLSPMQAREKLKNEKHDRKCVLLLLKMPNACQMPVEWAKDKI